jgi:hypothetical protein
MTLDLSSIRAAHDAGALCRIRALHVDLQSSAAPRCPETRAAELAAALAKETAGRQTLIFVGNEEDSLLLAAALRARGEQAHSLDEPDPDNIGAVLNAYRSGQIRILVDRAAVTPAPANAYWISSNTRWLVAASCLVIAHRSEGDDLRWARCVEHYASLIPVKDDLLVVTIAETHGPVGALGTFHERPLREILDGPAQEGIGRFDELMFALAGLGLGLNGAALKRLASALLPGSSEIHPQAPGIL